MSKKAKKPSDETIQQIEDVYRKYHRTGSVCWIALDHYVVSNLEEFASQPADSLLYDLGLLSENSYILAKAGDIAFDDFVDKIAYAEVIGHLSTELEKARKELEELKNMVE